MTPRQTLDFRQYSLVVVSFVSHSTDETTHSLLIRQHLMYLQISHLRQHPTLHDGPALIVLDIPDPSLARERDLLRETLLLEISDSVIVGISEEVVDAVMGPLDVVFERVHKVRTVPLYYQLTYASHKLAGLTLICSELSTAQKTISAKPLLSNGR